MGNSEKIKISKTMKTLLKNTELINSNIKLSFVTLLRTYN
jgi:hypothetical protein